MRKISLLLGAIAFLAMGTCVATAQGNGNENGQGATILEQEFESSFYVDCCDEDVTWGGTLHIVLMKNGKEHFNLKGMTAEGSNGNTYHGNVVEQHVHGFDEEGIEFFELHQKATFVSSSGCRFTVHIITTFYFDDGVFIGQEDKKFEIKCEGDLS